MSRDHRKLEAFQLADRLVLDLYRITKALPTSELYGLQSKLRRAAVSSATNIVAHGSAREVSYLLALCIRLDYLTESAAAQLADGYDHTAAMLSRIIDNLS